MDKKINKKDIAIIGMSGAFPGSESIADLWNNILDGKELIHFYSDEELKTFGIETKEANKIYADAFMPNSETFDYSFFGFTKEEAIYMDPQTRKFFEIAWSAIENSGYDIARTDKKIGVFAAASDNINWRAFANFSKTKTLNPFYLGQISNKNYLNTLLSYKLDLKGPSYNINTACSSSLVAVHLACRHLLLRECSMAIAGGVRITTTQERGYEYQEGMILSKDGHCRAFDAEATGAVFGEGAGVVVLKRLEDAYADNDHIYAVIKASSTNNDGANKNGFTAPGVEGQYNCIRQAHKFAGIEPDSISFIESHGTGTNLGDGIEIEALNLAFESKNNKTCAIGSIKTNVGHLDAASGVTGLIKAALTIKNRKFPPSLHFEQPNQNIRFEDGPFYVNTTTATLENKDILRGAVSSFGMGGTNAHVIVEEAPSYETRMTKRSSVDFLPFSAKSLKTLEKYEQNIQAFINSGTENVSDLCYTFKTGRKQLNHRGFFLVDGTNIVSSQLASEPKKYDSVTFLFTGQGSQFSKMSESFYTTVPYYKEWIDKGLTILNQIDGTDYRDILFNTNAEIHDTKYAQPLLFLVEYALAKTFMHWGIVPNRMIGHSLGEYVAAAISEVFTFEEALALIIKRATLMNSAKSGSMLAALGDIDTLTKLMPAHIDIAAINTNNSIVFSGNTKVLNGFEETLKANDVKTKQLKTSHAFHSESMDSILNDFKKALENITLQEPKIPYISNSTGTYIKPEEATSVDYWVSHIRNTVNFKDGINTLLRDEDAVYVEIGIGNTLINMVKEQSEKKISGFSTLANQNDTDNDQLKIQYTLGQLWLGGIDIFWDNYYKDSVHYKVPAPTYPFEKTVFPVKVNPMEKQSFNLSIVEHEFQVDDSTNQKENEKSIVKPQNEVQEKLVSIWQDFFEAKQISIDDDYFELGGSSLQAVVIVNRINEAFDTNLSIQNLYNYLTIRDLSKLLLLSLQQNKPSEETQESDQFVI
ncbi:Phthiocerol/phenolphthiocerol synthesis polyketide synthase type I PpsE [Kordia antarctica]|uniref:Phthiocerol/phenolphthiocerol synthesis polyketide synthase type I PpsE n=1 Tax=Kordia antarctica TaxID=1218801 RepID=A0A7L4ZG67_9FLAO|nr:type I polyketide synthase [Kordia antarctica]QHI35411.1 Phthiocerol/phenolphthiocerol synthesis polyketide synthase type I PpsE [Kordia antarctica]